MWMVSDIASPAVQAAAPVPAGVQCVMPARQLSGRVLPSSAFAMVVLCMRAAHVQLNAPTRLTVQVNAGDAFTPFASLTCQSLNVC